MEIAIDKKKHEFEEIHEETADEGKEVYTIYGHKGCGKTTCAFGFPGDKIVLCFDRKAMRVKKGMYNNLKEIHIYNCLKYYEPGEKSYTESSSKSFDYAMHILNNINETDWIVIDGLDRLVRICEMKMRFTENIEPFKGFANMSLWKLRRLYLRQLHEKAIGKARKGIVYTTYVDKDEIIENGSMVLKKDVPKWVDITMEETDAVIRIKDEVMKDGMKHYFAYIDSSKIPSLESGTSQDITNTILKFK